MKRHKAAFARRAVAPKSRLTGYFPFGRHHGIIEPHQQSRRETDPGNYPPHASGLVLHFTEIMEQATREDSANEISDSNGQKGVAHKHAFLAGRRQTRNVFVIT